MADSTGAVKIREGLYLKDAQAGVSTAVTGINRAVAANPKSSITAGVRSTTGGAEVTAINTSIDALGNNRLMVDNSGLGFVIPKSTQTLVWAGKKAVNDGVTIYTVTTGKTFYCFGAWVGSAASAIPYLQIGGAGDPLVQAYPTGPTSGAIGTLITGGIVFKATSGQTITVTGGGAGQNYANIWGWEE